MHDSKGLPAALGAPPGTVVSTDGRTQVVRAGAWHVRMELEALGAGELVGVGSMSMPAKASANSSEVLIGGTIEDDGTARLRVVPVAHDGRADVDGRDASPITLRVRLIQHPDTSEPIVSEVLDVEGGGLER